LQFPCLALISRLAKRPRCPVSGGFVARSRPEAGGSLELDVFGTVRALSAWIVGLLASPAGIVVLAALDSTIFFSFPGAIDAAVVVLAARGGPSPWIATLLATAGSVGGAALTFWMGAKIGAPGLDRYMSAGRLDRVRRRIHNAGAVGLAVLDLIPPPFPFTPFILAAGALTVDATTFFVTLAVCRLIRFGLEALLAAIYGRALLTWFDSDVFHDIVIALSVLGLTLTILTIAKLVAASRTPRRNLDHLVKW
jgi:membrane protein YqaA with SNARE-associated domain